MIASPLSSDSDRRSLDLDWATKAYTSRSNFYEGDIEVVKRPEQLPESKSPENKVSESEEFPEKILPLNSAVTSSELRFPFSEFSISKKGVSELGQTPDHGNSSSPHVPSPISSEKSCGTVEKDCFPLPNHRTQNHSPQACRQAEISVEIPLKGGFDRSFSDCAPHFIEYARSLSEKVRGVPCKDQGLSDMQEGSPQLGNTDNNRLIFRTISEPRIWKSQDSKEEDKDDIPSAKEFATGNVSSFLPELTRKCSPSDICPISLIDDLWSSEQIENALSIHNCGCKRRSCTPENISRLDVTGEGSGTAPAPRKAFCDCNTYEKKEGHPQWDNTIISKKELLSPPQEIRYPFNKEKDNPVTIENSRNSKNVKEEKNICAKKDLSEDLDNGTVVYRICSPVSRNKISRNPSCSPKEIRFHDNCDVVLNINNIQGVSHGSPVLNRSRSSKLKISQEENISVKKIELQEKPILFFYEKLQELYFGFLGIEVVFIYCCLVLQSFAAGLLGLFCFIIALCSQYNRLRLNYIWTTIVYTIFAVFMALTLFIPIDGFRITPSNSIYKNIVIINIPFSVLFGLYNVLLFFLQP